MHKSQFIRDFVNGQMIDSQFLAKSKRLAEFRHKPGQYLNLVLSDASGDIDAKVWDNAVPLSEKFDEGDVVHVKGRVTVYNNMLQLNVTTLRRCQPHEYDLSHFVRSTDRDADGLVEQIRSRIEQVQNPFLKQLLKSFFDDPQCAAAFFASPAAKDLHHAYVGGLAEHVVNALQIARVVTHLYPQIDADLLTTGILLHDIGKLRELSGGAVVNYTDEGKLLGHVVLGALMVEEKMNAIPHFPAELRMRVSHMVLSHHGVLEYGSPVVPKTLEAIALHHIENMDAQLNHCLQAMMAAGDQAWSDYDKKWGRQFYVGRGATTNDSGTTPTSESSGGASQASLSATPKSLF
ncbi:MAG: OB-fold nucleic acid binding domain-containing protein [Abditibacteriales bacterium]|nr:OB-fold nucleic acid binding domain-containing protein [Abditibacteriales bacterium]MDW8366001.1 OB-fold nucleic acid binding domain-containing protein [Abditibacteriales bacterium]